MANDKYTEPLPPLTAEDISCDSTTRLALNMVGQCFDDLDQFSRYMFRYRVKDVNKMFKLIRTRYENTTQRSKDRYIPHPIIAPRNHAMSAWLWLTQADNYFRDLLMLAQGIHPMELKKLTLEKYGYLEEYVT